MASSFIMEAQWAVMQAIAQKESMPLSGRHACTGYWLGPLCLDLVSCSRLELEKTPHPQPLSPKDFSEQCPNPEPPRGQHSEVKKIYT